MIRFKVLLSLLLGALCLSMLIHAQDTENCARGYLNSVALIADDMRLPHEGRPHGLPEQYDWSAAPRIGYGDQPPTNWTAFIAWGQVYEDAQGNPATNTRVQIRDIEAYYLHAESQRWYLLQFDRLVEGAAYAEDFVDNLSVSADIRAEPDGSISIKAGGGYNFHFWPESTRTTIDPQTIGGIFTTVQARLILEDLALPDDRSQARYLMSMGGDYWLDLAAEWQSDWSTVGDVAIGRFRYITPEWQAFNMTTVPPAQLCANPPPLR
ncbi:MAG: hypothetical protein MUF87_10395 [Anaerolineae bacterium]|jgi:hypothetical protein|nr:hypothetical protein [Anaerolineae bacterium]